MTNSTIDGATLFREGMALIEGRASSVAFRDGQALLERAAAAGHPGALCQLATFAAMGAGRPQDWRRALDLLNRSAAADSELAQGQVRLLSAQAAGALQVEPARIDLSALMAVPEREVLSEAPRIRAIRQFVSADICAWIIDRAKDKLAPAMLWDDSGTGRVDPSRTNRTWELQATDMDIVTQLVRSRISLVTRVPEPLFEAPQVMHYAGGQEFKPHFDFLDPQQPGEARDLAARGQRIATFLLYLNDDDEGGETIFPRCGLSWKGRAGDALFFANITPDKNLDPLTLHAGSPPSKGEKWLLSQWMRDRSPGP